MFQQLPEWKELCSELKEYLSTYQLGKGIDFINVYGDSMYPKYCSGEIID
jgi:phage repressor protein C with HTH and peptisase S24 domain